MALDLFAATMGIPLNHEFREWLTEVRMGSVELINKHHDLTKEIARDVKSLRESHKALASLVEAMINERGAK